MSKKGMQIKVLTQKEFARKVTTLPKDWKTLSNKIKQRDHFKCQNCGIAQRSGKYPLIVHHQDEDQSNNTRRNLVTLCRECHSKIPTTPIENLYEKYLQGMGFASIEAYMNSQPKFPQRKNQQARKHSLKMTKGRPKGTTLGAVQRRQMRGGVIGEKNPKCFKSKQSWEEWWWKKYNALCLKCRNECKQSQYVKIIVCPSYIK